MSGILIEKEAGELALKWESLSAQEVIALALERWEDRAVVCISMQITGMVILDIATKIRPDLKVITLNTGRLHSQTIEFAKKVSDHFGCEIETLHPDQKRVEKMVELWGSDLFRQSVEARTLCCKVRKDEPLSRALESYDAWFTGLLRDGSEKRRDVPKIGVDKKHGGIAKIAPLADWKKDDVWSYVKEKSLPVHPIYSEGYTSIGCQPCTRPTKPGEDERAGRWWWESGENKECGLHWTGPAPNSMESELLALT